jgi:hypothetical protein
VADITGPISTLPGAAHAIPDRAACDRHPDRLAVARIQGETDSFGSELIDACEECRDELRKHREADRIGFCEWCARHATDLRETRDHEEGACGRVYRVCGYCIRRANEEAAEELERYERERGDWGDD